MPSLDELIVPGSTITMDGSKGSTAKPPIVFVHGVMHGAWFWGGFMKELSSRGYKTYAFSLPCNADRSLQASADAIQLFIEEVVKAPCVLVGHSGGGHFVQHYLCDVEPQLNNANKVVAACLLASGTCDPDAGKANVERWMGRMMGDVGAKFEMGTKGMTPELFKFLFFSDATDATTISGESLTIAEYSAKLLTNVGDSQVCFGQHPPLAELKEHPSAVAKRIPVLVVSTEYDPIQAGKCTPPLEGPAEASTLVDKVAELWAATNSNRLHIEKMGHCMGDAGWETAVIEPIAAWLEKNTAK